MPFNGAFNLPVVGSHSWSLKQEPDSSHSQEPASPAMQLQLALDSLAFRDRRSSKTRANQPADTPAYPWC